MGFRGDDFGCSAGEKLPLDRRDKRCLEGPERGGGENDRSAFDAGHDIPAYVDDFCERLPSAVGSSSLDTGFSVSAFQCSFGVGSAGSFECDDSNL